MEIYVGLKYYFDDIYKKRNVINTVVEIRDSDIYVEYYEHDIGEIVQYVTTKQSIEMRLERYGKPKIIKRGDLCE